MLRNLFIWLRMIKFSHSVFALPFAIMMLFLAGRDGRPGFPGWGKLGLIVWCMVWARAAAMTFNRIADILFDARNPRTAARALPTGQITRLQAYVFLYLCALLFVAGTYLFWRPIALSSEGPRWFGYGNVWPLIMALPVLLFICLYSYTKRFTWASHFWLGASLMCAPMGAWVAVSPPAGPVIAAPPLILGAAVLFWTAGFDIIYACQDIEIDRRDGLYSIPAQLGLSTALWISRTCHSLAVTFLLILALLTNLGLIYLIAVVTTALLLIVEHLLVRQGRMSRIKIAFGTLNGLVSLLLAAAAICDIML